MTIFRHELKRGKISLIIWTVAIAFMLAVCCIVFPEMKDEVGELNEMFANMGSFTSAFGMDRINFGEFIGYFGIECGNVLGIGGAFFAALLGISALAKEEKDHTAEFLLTAPVSRVRVVTEKLLAIVAQIAVLDLVTAAVTLISAAAIGEKVDLVTVALIFLAHFLLQIEVASITFGISAFIRRGSLGIGLGLAACFYFLNIIANLVDETKFLKYFTPFGYTESADIIMKKALNSGYLVVGMSMAVVGIAAAYVKYSRKDIA